MLNAAGVRLGTHYLGCEDHIDGKTSLEWLLKAREGGNGDALKELRSLYLVGRLVPRNKRIADAYLAEAIEKKYKWAVYSNIMRKVTDEDPTAVDDLIVAAESGNCHAQTYMVNFYITRKVLHDDKTQHKVGRNQTKSYFWSLITMSTSPTAKHLNLGGRMVECGENLMLMVEKEIARMTRGPDHKSLPDDLRALAEDAAAIWSPGDPEPNLPAPGSRP